MTLIRRNGPTGGSEVTMGVNAAVAGGDTTAVAGIGARTPARTADESMHTDDVLRAGETIFRTMFEHAPIGIALIDSVSGRIYEVNKCFAEIVGRPIDEMATIDWMQITHPDDVQADLDNMALLNAGTIQGFTMEKRYIRPDGSLVWINMTIASMPEESRSGTRHLCMIKDITEVRQIEARLRQAERMDAIGQLAGGIAHDFNNVLGGIIGYTDMSLRLAEKGSVLEKNLRKVLKVSDRAKHLVRQILAFSQGGDSQRSVLSLRPIVKEVLQLLRASIPSSVTIESDLQKDTKAVHADPTTIHEVLVNLAANAVDAMGRRGTLTIRLYGMHLGHGAYGKCGEILAGDFTIIEVSDTGCGMDAVTSSKAFEPFFTTKAVGEGSGMGLSVVLGVVKSYGGDIQVETAIGMGTTFRIFLPAMKDDELTGIGVQSTACKPGTERILFVDDEPMMIDMVKEWLTELGYRVIAEADSVAALTFLREHAGEIDLLITDQTMPGVTGMELSKEALKIRRDLPIILCTGFSSEVNPERAAAIGVDRFVMKPYRSAELCALIRDVLDTTTKGG